MTSDLLRLSFSVLAVTFSLLSSASICCPMSKLTLPLTASVRCQVAAFDVLCAAPDIPSLVQTIPNPPCVAGS